MILDTLFKENLLNDSFPSWSISNCAYITKVGSYSYGLQTNRSDVDLLGIVIPPKNIVFPTNFILGFGKQPKSFFHWAQKDINYLEKDYEVKIYGIVHFMNLLLKSSPNLIESLFVSDKKILFITDVGKVIRDKRHLFLTKSCYNSFSEWAAQETRSMSVIKNTEKRKENFKKFGYDTKSACNAVRLLLEAKQILDTGDLSLQFDKEFLSRIRDGQYTKEEVLKYIEENKAELDESYTNSKLPDLISETDIKNLLLDCLNQHYGSLIVQPEINIEDCFNEICKNINSSLSMMANAIRGR